MICQLSQIYYTLLSIHDLETDDTNTSVVKSKHASKQWNINLNDALEIER